MIKVQISDFGILVKALSFRSFKMNDEFENISGTASFPYTAVSVR